MGRSFLFLQAVASPFFSELGQLLRQAGHRTHRVNFCGGDLLLSRAEAHSNYTGTLADLPAWMDATFTRHGVSDVVLFGDCRAVHRPAIALAEARKLRVHVLEEGYLRPDWITLERGGVNGYSHMDLQPASIAAWAERQPAAPLATPPYQGQPTLLVRAAYDIAYRLANTALCWRFAGYVSHRPHNGLLEYAGLARRFGLRKHFEREAQALCATLLAQRTPYFLFPLQLNADSQIRTHSPFADVRASIDAVLQSFQQADWGGSDAAPCLVIKNHPLDTGLARYRSHVAQRARALGLGARVQWMEGGDLAQLLAHAQGVVLVNSTTGLAALGANRPVFAMGQAIFNRPGLTHQGDLASFWKNPVAPDPHFLKAFLAYITTHSQVRGDFYSGPGRAHAARACVQRMLEAAP